MNKSDIDPDYWKSPGKYALLKEVENVSNYKDYTIFTKNNGRLMMCLIDDATYWELLVKKMLNSGALVFKSINDLQNWAANE